MSDIIEVSVKSPASYTEIVEWIESTCSGCFWHESVELLNDNEIIGKFYFLDEKEANWFRLRWL